MGIHPLLSLPPFSPLLLPPSSFAFHSPSGSMRGRARALKINTGEVVRGQKRRTASAARLAEAACQPAMEALLNCWKTNTFQDSKCASQLLRYERCLTTEREKLGLNKKKA